MLSGCATSEPELAVAPAPVVQRLPVQAQPLCALRVEVLANLAKKYGETPVAMGVTNNGGLVEVLASADGTTWTIIVSQPNGTSCLVAAGEGWRSKAPVDPRT